MLNAGVFDDFKDAKTTLLLWGDEKGMAVLFAGLSALRESNCDEFTVDGADTRLTVCLASGKTQWSRLLTTESGMRWECCHDTVELAADLVEPLLQVAGHQFLDVTGLAEQVIIARDEYAADLR